VTDEHEHHRPVLPECAQSLLLSSPVAELEAGKLARKSHDDPSLLDSISKLVHSCPYVKIKYYFQKIRELSRRSENKLYISDIY
jgi:hypothetical protein